MPRWLTGLVLSALLGSGAVQAEGGDREFKLLGEFTPSASLSRGAAIERLDYARKAELTRGVMSAVPLARLAELFDLADRDLEWAYRSGGYQQSITPNLVVSLSSRVESERRVRLFALAWMYVYQQDAVPFYFAADGGRRAMRVRFQHELNPAREHAMYAALLDTLGDQAGYTRIGADEIVVLDLAGQTNFYERLTAFVAAMRDNPVVRVTKSTVHAECRSHDWRRDPAGAALLAEIVQAFPAPGLEARLRALRARYEAFVAGWLALRAADPVGQHADVRVDHVHQIAVLEGR